MFNITKIIISNQNHINSISSIIHTLNTIHIITATTTNHSPATATWPALLLFRVSRSLSLPA